MTCPACGMPVGEPIVRNLSICSCLRSVVQDGDVCRLATAAETTVLSDAELAVLRKRRKAIREAA